jgi:hypothetical protein
MVETLNGVLGHAGRNPEDFIIEIPGSKPDPNGRRLSRYSGRTYQGGEVALMDHQQRCRSYPRRTTDPRSDRPRRDRRMRRPARHRSRAEASGISVPSRNLAERRQGLAIVCLLARSEGSAWLARQCLPVAGDRSLHVWCVRGGRARRLRISLMTSLTTTPGAAAHAKYRRLSGIPGLGRRFVPGIASDLNASVGFTWCQRVISRYMRYQEPAQTAPPTHLTRRIPQGSQDGRDDGHRGCSGCRIGRDQLRRQPGNGNAGRSGRRSTGTPSPARW